MREHILAGLRIKLFLTVVLGIGYPLAVTGISQLLFFQKANGSLIHVRGKVLGSALIGENFSRPEYFHPRPSAAGEKGYDATASGGSNYGPTNKKLIDRVSASVKQFREENPDYHGPIPADLVTASASGLDPDISPDSARAQGPRVAKTRGVARSEMDRLIAQYTEQPSLGFLGEPRVNVLKLNLAMDRKFSRR